MQKNQNYISNLIRHLRTTGDVIFLESQMDGHQSSTKSYLAAQPESLIQAVGEHVEVVEASESRSFTDNPWTALQAFREKHTDWMFGFLGYDLKNSIEKLECTNPALIQAPDLYFMVPGLLIEIDTNGELNVLKGVLPENLQEEKGNARSLDIRLQNRISQDDYMSHIEQAKNDIYEGAYYEINLSHALEYSLEGDSLDLYQAMKKEGPVPFAGYIELENLSVCCSSPERFLAREGKRLWSQPIKGTALRVNGSDSEHAVKRLKESEKERAENLMIVDLVRNDLSRVALKNSVRVSKLFEIQSFETVHQMVSTVECELDSDLSSVEVLKACFPMGSMTGAPKIASMEAIERYENYKRGVYSGALGYFKPDDDFDFNVIIRTAIIEGEKLVYPVGGAITSDSDPEDEWAETLVKARAITNIFQNL